MNYEELINILKTAEIPEDVDAHREEIGEYIPLLKEMFGYDQRNMYHCYDLWEHTIRTVAALPKNIDDDMLYLAALLHDIGKPESRRRAGKDDDPFVQYTGHPRIGMEIVRDQVIPLLEKKGVMLSDEEKVRLLYYVKYHDEGFDRDVRLLYEHMKLTDFETFRKLMKLAVADMTAHIQEKLISDRKEWCEKMAGDYGEKEYSDMLENQKLIRLAIENQKNSYAPYSRFNVSAALLTGSGNIYTGVNVENAAYGATICAERNAITTAVNAGDRRLVKIAIIGGPDYSIAAYCPPCGTCRQVMREFAKPDGLQIILAKSPEDYRIFTLAQLLPENFGPDDMEQ